VVVVAASSVSPADDWIGAKPASATTEAAMTA